MEENEKFDSDFSNDKIPISEEFWNYMENYWHNNREFPESTEASLSKKADLVDGKVPASQLPSYVDDVLEFDSFDNLPNPGEKGKIYLVTNDNSQFRWSDSGYIQLNSDEFLMTTNTVQHANAQKFFDTFAGGSWNNNSLVAYGVSPVNPAITFYKEGESIGQIQYDLFNFNFINHDGSGYDTVRTGGYYKYGSNNDYFLTGGGGHISKHTKEDSYFHSSRNFTEGTLIKTTVDYSVEYGHQFLLEMKGNMYTENLPLEMKMQGYIYYGKIICTRGYSTYSDLKKITAMNLDGKLCFWFPRLGYWQGFSVKLTIGYGGLENGINRVTAVEDSVDPQGSKRVEIYIDTLSTQEWSNENLWKKYNSSTFKGINDNDTRNFSFLQNDGNIAKKINTGGVLVSDAYSDETYIPSNGIYSKGDIVTKSNIHGKALYSPVLNGGQVFHAGNSDSLYIGNPTVKNVYFESANSNLLHYRNGYGIGHIWDSHNFNPDNYVQQSQLSNYTPLDHKYQFLQSDDTGIIDANSLFEDYKFKFSQRIESGSENMFPVIDNANSIISIASHPGGYGVQLGFNDNEESYIRSVTAGSFGKWKQFAYRDWVANNYAPISSLNSYLMKGYLSEKSLSNANLIIEGTQTNYLWGDNKPSGSIDGSLLSLSYSSVWSTQLYGDWRTNDFYVRNQDNGIWGSWNKLWSDKHFTQSDIDNWNNNRFNKIPINYTGTAKDANNIINSGFYTIAEGTKNTGEYTSSQDGQRMLLHFETEDVYSASQIQTERYTGNTISRTRTDGVWSNWIKHWGNNDFSQNDINNWNNIANTATTQSWVESQDYANHAFVEESLNQLTVEHINPDYPISTISKVNTIIITEEFGREFLELEREFIPERQITVTNLSPQDIGVMIEDKIIDRVLSGETTEYYITSEKRLVKKGSYRNASLLI
ncbi:hypothetical protein [Chryseobacterium sp. Hurlbut01]|jgi:hypothetical protein|uniref:hypothetical protein n=1 Tax=Chryseobacterium sp. Hurlbut01 TaxID=1681828 RepID=UPI00067D1470|nr:hypothetical protein [Chryseobacterium sp. Hurlbut01]KNB62345.1 hypothetical protein AC804_05690 [Chryseobacterium sp. Hurlbut01]